MSDEDSEDLTRPIDVSALTREDDDTSPPVANRATPATLTPVVDAPRAKHGAEPADETSIDGLLVTARQLHADGAYDASHDVCRRVMRLAPENEEAAALALRNADLARLSIDERAEVEAPLPRRPRQNTAVLESGALEALRKATLDDDAVAMPGETREASPFSTIGEALAAATRKEATSTTAEEEPSPPPAADQPVPAPDDTTSGGSAKSDEAATLRALGGRYAIPLLIQADASSWGAVGHEVGYLISRIDGVLTYDEILEIAGMPRADALRLLVSLREKGIIEST